MTAYFVDAPNFLDRTIGRVQSFNSFVEHVADLFDDALVDFILPINRQDSFSSYIEDNFAEWNPAQLSVLVQQPWNQLIDRRFRWRRLCEGDIRDNCQRNEGECSGRGHPSIENPPRILSKRKLLGDRRSFFSNFRLTEHFSVLASALL